MHKEVKQLIAQLEAVPGVSVDMRPTHPKVTKDGKFVTALPTTPSKPSWYQNALAALRRGGIDLSKVPVVEPRVKTKLEPLPTSLPRIPETEFSVPAELSKPKRKKTGGIAVLSPEQADVLRGELRSFLDRKGLSVRRFSAMIVNIGRKEGFKTYKTDSAAEVALGDFLNRKRGISEWGANAVAATMSAIRGGEKISAPKKRVRKKPVKPVVVSVTPVEVTTPLVMTAPELAIQNGTLDLFLSLIENRALTKSELINALTLAEMQTEFEHAHPRA